VNIWRIYKQERLCLVHVLRLAIGQTHLSSYAENVALPAFAAARRAAAACYCGAGRAAIDRYLKPAPHAAAACERDRQTDGHRTVS